MAIGTTTALVGGALLGGLAGSQGRKESITKQLGAETAFEKEGGKTALNNLKNLEQLIQSQGGQEDVEQARSAQQAFIKRLQQMAETGGLPSAEELKAGQQLASNQFAPQQVALDQALRKQSQESARLAGQMGRTTSDPILQAKLAQLRAEGTERLQAGQQAAASQFAQNLVGQKLGFQESATNLQSQLASQALQNRQTLVNLGSGLFSQGANFRLGSASTTTTSGGGLGGALTGAIGGAGAGLSLFNSFGGLGGSGAATVGAGSSGGFGGGAGFGPQAMVP